MIDRDTLTQSYSRMSDEELLDLHILGTITDLAYEVLEEELEKRHVTIPERPPTKDEQLSMAYEMLVMYYSNKSDEELKEIILAGKLDFKAQMIVQGLIKDRFPEEEMPELLKLFISVGFLAGGGTDSE